MESLAVDFDLYNGPEGPDSSVMRRNAPLTAGPARRGAVIWPYRRAGVQTARRLRAAERQRRSQRALKQRAAFLRHAIESAIKSDRSESGPHHLWLVENARLLLTATKEARDFVVTTRECPVVANPNGDALVVPRITALVRGYLDAASGVFDEEHFVTFMASAQEEQELQFGELWASRPALLFELLERVVSAWSTNRSALPNLIGSIRNVGEGNWKELFEAMSVVDRILAREPADAYARMDYDSRDAYRRVISDLAKYSGKNEHEVAELAVALAADVARSGRTDVATLRRTHVGYYLIDRGLVTLKQRIGYGVPMLRELREAVLARPTAFYLGGIAVATLIIVGGLGSFLGLGLLSALVVFLLLLLPATQAAVEFINGLATALVTPHALPKLDFSEGIPADCSTLVAVPALLLNPTHVHELVMDLEIRYLANRDRNLFFALVTDSPDSDQPAAAGPDTLVALCERLIRDLNQRYGSPSRTPFFLLHRNHVYNPSEGRWMGWERKRGKLLDLNRLLRGGFDSFPVKVGELSVLSTIRYVITLDSDTQLPRDAAHRLIGTMAHPLNRAVIDPATKVVVEGYGILQPRVGVSTKSASRSYLATLLAGQTGYDIYTCAVSDVYQDLFGEGSFTGKGIYEVDAFRESLEHRFPENTLLSHDLIEGAFARAGLASDIELIDDYPTHFSAYSRRKHRWMRGDWQLLRWLLARVPDARGRMVANPIGAIGRWKIVDNLRRSLFEPATLLLLLAGWFVLPGPAYLWTSVSIGMLLMPAYAHLLVSLVHAPWGHKGFGLWAKDTLNAFAREHVVLVLHLTYLLHDALLAVDAIVRSLARVFVTRTRLLEWETAAEAAVTSRRKGAADIYLEWSPFLAAFITGALLYVRPSVMAFAAPVLALWMLARPLATWLAQPPRGAAAISLSAEDERLLRTSAVRVWRFFREFSSARFNWLVPDNVREDGPVAERLSPTNLGFLLNSRVAAVHFGYLTVPEFARDTLRTLDAAARLPRFRGHFLNWYATDRFQALDPLFISTVDSGNLAACLWTLKQSALSLCREAPDDSVLLNGIRDLAYVIGDRDEPTARALSERLLRLDGEWQSTLPQLEELARHFAANAQQDETKWWANELVTRIERARAWGRTGLTARVREDLEEIARRADTLVSDMDFAFLYDVRKKVLSIGYDTRTQQLDRSTYDLLASEARIASFVAIAKGDVPQRSWFHLGRTHVLARGERVLASWTGTAFEYLMPALWMRHYPRTIMQDSMHAVVKLQQKFVRRRGIPWGVSESGCITADAAPYGYAAFGLPDVSLKQHDEGTLVVSPYSSFLALLMDPDAALANLRHMDSLGWMGQYGPYEAVDYSSGQPQLVRSWMAHHQGMSLLAICNVLCGNVFHRDFHAEPQVLATELLLQERVPRSVLANVEDCLLPLTVPEERVVA